MQLGIDRLLTDRKLIQRLKSRRVAMLAHPASVTSDLKFSVDALYQAGLSMTALLGPQHGLRGEKQDNMVESEDFIDPIYQIPVFSLYSRVRHLTFDMMNTFDLVLVDLQDLGTRVYTFLSTLFYLLEDCARFQKAVWVLDRPNPVGRWIEGSLLQEGYQSFVGVAPIPMRHGMTLGELAAWWVHQKKLNLEFQVVALSNYDPTESPGYGWPTHLSWVNPSPNAASVSMARCYPGTVLLEGTYLSEGRGTTRPLELLGAPGLDASLWLKKMFQLAPHWLKGCALRACYFQPTFQKYTDQLCAGFQIHTESGCYQPDQFRPYRLIALALKALRSLKPEFILWRDFHYEYEKDRLAIDLISGSSFLRHWIEDPHADVIDFEKVMDRDELSWEECRKPFLYYLNKKD